MRRTAWFAILTIGLGMAGSACSSDDDPADTTADTGTDSQDGTGDDATAAGSTSDDTGGTAADTGGTPADTGGTTADTGTVDTGGDTDTGTGTGGDTGSGTDDGTGSGDDELDQVAADMAEAICDRVEECFFDFPSLFKVTGCSAALQTTFATGALPQWKAAEEAGTAEIDVEALKDCLAALKSLPCEDLGELPDSCNGAITGKVEAGDDCVSGVECVAGTYCDIEDACPGKCTAPLAADADCSGGGLCGEALVCHEDKCVTAGAEGQACGLTNAPCTFGLFCIGIDEDADTAGTCSTFGSLQTQKDGEVCDGLTAEFCVPGLYCLVDAVDGENVSFVCGPAADAGGACRPGLPDPCPGGEICVAPTGEIDGTCTALPGADEECLKAGEVDGTGLLFCGQGHICVDNKCAAVGGLGDACKEDGLCVTGLCEDNECSLPDPCE